MELSHLFSFDEELEAEAVLDASVAAGDDRVYEIGRGKKRDELFAEIFGELLRCRRAFAAEGDFGEMGKRWIAEEFAHFEFAREEGIKVLGSGMLDGRVIGEVGLDEHFSGKGAAASASCDLDDELKDCFRCAKVGDIEA